METIYRALDGRYVSQTGAALVIPGEPKAMTPDLPTLSPAAARTRAYRQRKRAGSTLVTLVISAQGADAMVKLGWLAPKSASDPTAIADAVLALAGEAAAMGLRPTRARAHT